MNREEILEVVMDNLVDGMSGETMVWSNEEVGAFVRCALTDKDATKEEIERELRLDEKLRLWMR